MTRAWRSTLALIPSVNTDGAWAYSFSDCPSGSTLLRTLVSLYGYSLTVMPTAFDPDLNPVPCPLAWFITEINSEVNPGPPAESPWGITGSGHEVAGSIARPQFAPGWIPNRIDGNTSLRIDAGYDYDLTIERTNFMPIMVYSEVDSHAQRFFSRGEASFIFTAKAGPLASFITDNDYVVVARIQHLINVP